MTGDAEIGLIGVAVGWGLTSATDWFRVRLARKQHARYLATRISILLDQYVIACMWVVRDDGYGLNNPDLGDNPPEPQVELPPFPEYPTDVNWKSINHNLMVRLLTLPINARAGNDQINFAINVDGPPWDTVFEERQVQYSQLGLNAIHLKEDLEKICGIVSRPVERYEPQKVFEERLKELEETRKRRALTSDDDFGEEAVDGTANEVNP